MATNIRVVDDNVSITSSWKVGVVARNEVSELK
jgi:hypothetical protein